MERLFNIEETDSVMEYVLPAQADILIYKQTSLTALDDLCQLLSRFTKNSENYVSDELTFHSKGMIVKPTIHDTLIRRLYLQPKKIRYNMKALYDKNLNRKILSAMEFIEECNDAGNDHLSKFLDDLKKSLNLATIKGKILGDPSCHIENGQEILQKIESAIYNETREG